MKFELIVNNRNQKWSIDIVTYDDFCSLNWNKNQDYIVVGNKNDAKILSGYELKTNMFWFDKEFISVLNSLSSYKCGNLENVNFEGVIFVGAQFYNVTNSTLFALIGKSKIANLINSHIDVVGNNALIENMLKKSKIQSLAGTILSKDDSSNIYETLEGAIIRNNSDIIQ